MTKLKRFFLILIFFILILTTLKYAWASNTTTTFIVPGNMWNIVPVMPIGIAANPGNVTINLTIYLQSVLNPANFHYNNSVSAVYEVEQPDGSIKSGNFINTLNNGLYQFNYTFVDNGTYTITAVAYNITYGVSYNVIYVYIGKYPMDYTFYAVPNILYPGNSSTIYFIPTNNSLYQNNGTSNLTIQYPGGAFLEFGRLMINTDGIYYNNFIAPSTLGSYNINVTFNQGPNTIYAVSNFNVTGVPTSTTTIISSGGGGGSSVSRLPTKPFYDLEVRLTKNIFYPTADVKASIFIINMGEMPDADAVLEYYIQCGQKKYDSNVKVFKEIDIGGKVEDVSLVLTEFFPLKACQFVATYETINQPLIVAKDTFIVAQPWELSALILILAIVTVIYILYRLNKKHTK